MNYIIGLGFFFIPAPNYSINKIYSDCNGYLISNDNKSICGVDVAKYKNVL